MINNVEEIEAGIVKSLSRRSSVLGRGALRRHIIYDLACQKLIVYFSVMTSDIQKILDNLVDRQVIVKQKNSLGVNYYSLS